MDEDRDEARASVAVTVICARCKQPLVNGVRGYSADAVFTVCNRLGCQIVERMNERVAKGTLEFLNPEQFKVEIKFPVTEQTELNVSFPAGERNPGDQNSG